MKGLLLKDYLLLKKQKNFLLLIILIGFIFSVNNGTAISGISYVTYVVVFISISIFSYDEADNGMMHLMTLPAGRVTYVKEKYIFSLFNPLLICTLFTVAGSIFEAIRLADSASTMDAISELITASLILLFITWILFAVYFPIQIKFGTDKVRVVIFVIVGTIVAIGYLFSETNIGAFIDENLLHSLPFDLSNLSEWMAAGIIFVISVMANGISYIISRKVIVEKEF